MEFSQKYIEKHKTRFLSKVNVPSDETQCWVWTAGLNAKGYGRFKVRVEDRAGKPYFMQIMATHFMWNIHYGYIPAGKILMHTCDNPICVNPTHLRIGTHSDNAKDRVNKSRSGKPGAKLTQSQVDEIRRLYATGDYYQFDLATMFKVKLLAINRIIRGVTWNISTRHGQNSSAE